MERRHRDSPDRVWGLGMFLLAVGCLANYGCEATPLVEARRSYDRSDYAAAYARAEHLYRRLDGAQAGEAAYIAGMAAYQLHDADQAAHYLVLAVASDDSAVAGRAMAQLGLIDHERGRHKSAARRLLQAARRLGGEDRAHAYLSAAVAQQKLGQWKQAVASLGEARRQSHDPGLRSEVKERLLYMGFTLQVGAFAMESNARRAARDVTARANSLHLGEPRMVRAVDHDGRHLILVQVGRFNDYAAASAMGRQLSRVADVVPLLR